MTFRYYTLCSERKRAPEYMLKLAAPEGTPLQFDKLLGAARR